MTCQKPLALPINTPASGFRQSHPGLRKTVAKKLAPTIVAVIRTQTANTAQWATVLPIEAARADRH
jgi:hypothetical protein